MWWHDVGRENAANKPLLKTVFQVMMRLRVLHKITLIFVLRDKPKKKPLEPLKPTIIEDIDQIWNSFAKPEAFKDTRLSELFEVDIVALASYEEDEEQFKKEVATLRQQLSPSGGFAGDKKDTIPASGFSLSAQRIWKTIKDNKDLNLPAHKVMVATVRCEEIAKENLASFRANDAWRQLDRDVQSHAVRDFGKDLSSILNTCLLKYDKEAKYFDEGVRTEKRKILESNLLQLVHPAFESMLQHLRSQILETFKGKFDIDPKAGMEFFKAAVDRWVEPSMRQFDERCKDVIIEQADWKTSRVRDELQRDIDLHVASVRALTLAEDARRAREERSQNVRLAVEVAAGVLGLANNVLTGVNTVTYMGNFGSNQ